MIKIIEELLARGVERIYPSTKELEEKLKSGKKLRIYYGVDPTGALHIGHMVILRKLRKFQDLGHEIIILIGDFTATIGDPTDKKATRKPLTREQVLRNAKDYKAQIGKILDLKKSNIRFLHNEKWTNKLKPIDFLAIASQFTVAQLLERDMFRERIKNGKDIHMPEFLYPIFQAYDSVTMDVDMEIGGNDQTFNMLAGRDLMRKMKNKNKFVMAMSLLTDSHGVKIGKTEGNAIALADNPGDLFAKIMALSDDAIMKGMEYLTDLEMNDINQIGKAMKKGENPMGYKKKLAFEVVKQLNIEKDAEHAQENWIRLFSKKEISKSDIPELKLKSKKLSLLDLVFAAGTVKSKSEASRLIEQGAIEIDGNQKKDMREIVELKGGETVKIGKKNFFRIKI